MNLFFSFMPILAAGSCPVGLCLLGVCPSGLLSVLRFKSHPLEIIPAVICDFQQCSILTSVDLDEPVLPGFNKRFESPNDD